mmetsp:Transcript_36079/g.81081  ORF Transcript_36079/g.81081 Transcript_36079/m.81081 type:complete len:480 (+) Transcript_36079:364-1803(+)
MASPKRTVDDIWPIKGKVVLVRVDLNVRVQRGIVLRSNAHRIRDAIPTIKNIIGRGGKAVLISHVGRPVGHKWSILKDNKEQLDIYLRTWQNEHGLGFTSFYTCLDDEDKRRVIAWSSLSGVPQATDDLVAAFSALCNEEKKLLLERYQQESTVNSHKVLFPQLRSYNGFKDELSLRPVAARLSDLLNEDCHEDINVSFAPDCLAAADEVAALQPGDVLVLENVRFYSDENSMADEERLAMAKILASYGDYYVSEAFGTSHRRNSATMVDLPRVMGHGCCGSLMETELAAFSNVTDRTPRPTCAIIGGVKVTEKILMVEHLLNRIQYLVVGGAMSFTFLKAAGYKIGNSFHEKGQSYCDKYGMKYNIDELAREVLAKARACNVEVLLPVDHVCHTSCEPTNTPLITETANVPDGYLALDIGPRTIQQFTECIQNSRSALWNGPLGVYEMSTYATGSFSVAKALAEGSDDRGMLTIICGR